MEKKLFKYSKILQKRMEEIDFQSSILTAEIVLERSKNFILVEMEKMKSLFRRYSEVLKEIETELKK